MTRAGIQGPDREKLITERAALVKEIEALKASPISGKSQAAIRFRQEDLIALAKKVTTIDRKLGRIE